MDREVRARFERVKDASLTWHPVKGGKRSWVCFEDSLTADLGPDDSGHRFDLIADRMIHGHYYPPDAVQYFCEADDAGRSLEPGDRVLQFAPFLPFLPHFLGAWQMVEIFVANKHANDATLGYVTTSAHHGRGIWQSVLRRENRTLTMTVTSTTCPHSWLFWFGLPVARFLQLHARSRAIEEFRRLA